MKLDKFLLLLCFLLLITGCKKDKLTKDSKYLASSYSSDIIIPYYDLELKIVKTTAGYSPPVSSRLFSYTGIALYEALVNSMPDYNSMQVVFNYSPSLPSINNENNNYFFPEAANMAVYTIIKKMVPFLSTSNSIILDSIYKTNLEYFKTVIDTVTLARSSILGDSIASVIFQWSETDGGHNAFLNNFPSSYIPPVSDSSWVPTPSPMTPAFNYKPALQPYWGSNRPFLAVNVNNPIFTIPPPKFDTTTSSQFYKAAKEVYDTSLTLTPEQKAIAIFWRDESGSYSPPGHSIAITNIILKQTNATLEKAAFTYAEIGVGVADAFINCFKKKYIFNTLRPVTYINKYIDPSWVTLIGTPPFPEYASCHSTQSGAMAEILTKNFGEIAFTDNSKTDVGLPNRNFSNFHQAAQEAVISRFYGGVHYKFSCLKGYSDGLIIGENVNNLPWKK